MINWLHSKLHRPEKGWDPVPADHAASYTEGEWANVDETPLDELEAWIGGFADKRVLDLGGGPGQYTYAMARRGAHVTWHDVSRTYRGIAQTRCAGLPIEYSLGYLEEAINLGAESFDLVFNRICFSYSRSERALAGVIWHVLRPGGVAYVDTNNSRFHWDRLSAVARARTLLNSTIGWKIGHPFPAPGRLAQLFLKFPVQRVLIDYSRATNDRIIFLKPKRVV